MPDIDTPLRWHRRPWAAWLLRGCGLLLLFLTWRAGAALVVRGHAAHADAADYGLALIVYLGAGAGAASTVLGAHLFDQVPIASRWGHSPALDVAERRRGSATSLAPRSSGSRPPDR